jgi:hypothetical protein
MPEAGIGAAFGLGFGFELDFVFALDFFFAFTSHSFRSNKQIMAWRTGPVNEAGTRLGNTVQNKGFKMRGCIQTFFPCQLLTTRELSK